jgi:hypothetical protein
MEYGVDFPLFLSCDELALLMNPILKYGSQPGQELG